MLSSQGFDLWADGYDQSVGLTDEEGGYPFAGYKKLLNRIYQRGADPKVSPDAWISALAQARWRRGCISMAA